MDDADQQMMKSNYCGADGCKLEILQESGGAVCSEHRLLKGWFDAEGTMEICGRHPIGRFVWARGSHGAFVSDEPRAAWKSPQEENAMRVQDCYPLLIGALSSSLMGCASFSAINTAEINPGLSFSIKAGFTNIPSHETHWFYDVMSDCPLCKSSPISIAELGLDYGVRPLSFGVVMSGFVPQIQVRAQLNDGEKVDYGVGGRLGLSGGWNSHQLFLLFDYQLDDKRKILVSPGLFYYRGHSPNEANTGSLLFFTQSIGLAIENANVTVSPCISLITGKGELSVAEPERFDDTFVAFSLGFNFHKKKTSTE